MLIGRAMVTNADLDLQFEIAIAVRQIKLMSKYHDNSKDQSLLQTSNQPLSIAAILIVQDWQQEQKRITKILQMAHAFKESIDGALNFKKVIPNQRNSLSNVNFKQPNHEIKYGSIKFYQPIPDARSFNSGNALPNNVPQFELIHKTVTQIKEYVHGKRHYFNLPLDIGWVVDKPWQTCAQFGNLQSSLKDTQLAKHTGTPFQRGVWQQLLNINYGSTINYATLAAQVGKPKAYRAVANANAQNRWAIVLPCHRVIASSGKTGGYRYGNKLKRQLLNLETHFSK